MKLRRMFNWAIRQDQTKAFILRTADVVDAVCAFNVVWKDAYENVPFYAEWKERFNLPDSIKSFKEYSEWPILEKREIVTNISKFVRKDGKPYYKNVTGGSSGEPLHFYVAPGDDLSGCVNMWLGRARLGIFPDTRTVSLWGNRNAHSHGISSLFHCFRERLADWCKERLTIDATNLSSEVLTENVKKIIKFKPEAIIAYSASLLCLVRACSEYADGCKKLGIRGIVCTAGPLTKSERLEIEEFFDAPLLMEYGSMEGGVIAYQDPAIGGRYAVFDKTHIIQTCPEETTGREQVLLTKIYKCYFPLFRYKLGDYIEGAIKNKEQVVTEFVEVIGRLGDEVDMGNGIRFHGQSFMMCAEHVDKIIAYQIRVNKKLGTVVFIAQVSEPLSVPEKEVIIEKSSMMSGLPKHSIIVEEAKDLKKTPSGKIKLVLWDDVE